MTLFETGIRPKIDEYLDNKAKEKRDYGDYWSASSAGYCQRKNIFDRLKIPHTSEDPRKQRVFEVGHIFHEWMQRITRDAGLSIAQETELQDESLMVRGHIDDLILVDDRLILYDYKTQNSRAFTWQKDKPISYFHRMQLGTYMYMLRTKSQELLNYAANAKMDALKLGIPNEGMPSLPVLTEGRILKISKDDLRMAEVPLHWDDKLESQVKTYWREQNEAWEKYTKYNQLPVCSCADHENGFMANEKYNPYFFNGQPCSIEWLRQHEESADSEK